MSELVNDVHSFSKPAQVRVTHLNWQAKVDFKTKTIQAQADWQILYSKGDTLILDTKGLNIKEVKVDGKQPAFTLGNEDPILGQALHIPVNADSKIVRIIYTTSPTAEALQWLSAQQTADKQQPFLFTQSQAILARSWLPCQDSPGVRFTYEADVKVPAALMALMSASNPQQKSETGEYHFEMKQAIPSYLFALSVGDFAFKPISERSGIYAEPSVLDTAVWEFADLEKMIAGAESLYGAYAWERYDVLVLPPSFPFGGMENPRLTFATPTILAGDRSLTSLIAHELAHSWSGNLVTNATWSDFWLNEGFTVYFEHRIMEKLYGKDYSEMLAALSYADLQATITELTNSGMAEDTKLKLNLVNRNPDDGVTDIAYNKGYFFLRSIEEQFGREKFDVFLNDYFKDQAFKVMTTEAFIPYIRNYYQSKFKISLTDELFDKWIFTVGLPEDCPKPQSLAFEKVDQALNSWLTTNELPSKTTQEWTTHEWLHFLNNLPAGLSEEQMVRLDQLGKFTESDNAEILCAWLVQAVRYNYKPAYVKLESFLVNTGRRKFLSPIYQELLKTADGKQRAQAIYEKARPNYHFVATNTFDAMLKK
ncbi:M1 family peptidase [Chryseotalea sanaruensis]|uniref:Aminopeptidase N n=2 Tax=Chryseotalea sanaruensis TaxID=2482724 RepID=A0A401U8T0_9BACT|nr:M1 family peptidase [Chryseotalea sanaruensis]